MQEFKDRVAVVTGAASGIGFALAAAFAAEGMQVVLADIEAAALSNAVATLQATGAEVAGVRTDVTEHAVRNAGLANGLVDFKIAAIDETWSGLRFAAVSRRPDRTRTARGAIPSPRPAP